MLNLNLFAKLGIFLYLITYLIFPKLAITQNTNVDIRKNLENALNTRNFELIKKNFKDEEILNIQAKFSQIIKDFPNAKWQIKRSSEESSKEEIFNIKVKGQKIVNGQIYDLESNLEYKWIKKSKVNEYAMPTPIKKVVSTLLRK